MAHSWTDNVHTTAFSPRDFQVELLAAAREKNTIVCLEHKTAKEFIAVKLIHELAYQLRAHTAKDNEDDDHPGGIESGAARLQRRVTLYLCDNGLSAYNQIFHLTDLSVVNLTTKPTTDEPNAALIDWRTVLPGHQVVICTPAQCARGLHDGHLNLAAGVNLLVISDCHLQSHRRHMDAILAGYYAPSNRLPRILGLAGPLHGAGCPPGHLGAELRHLERRLHSNAETASDIVSVLRYCHAPVELLLQCAPPATVTANGDGGGDASGSGGSLNALLRDLVGTRLAFLRQHRFDPSEIYDDAELMEEMRRYPDPKAEPLQMLCEFLDVLDELGAWCADRAALSLLQRIEKLKVKTPYERHFLLLCMVSTVFVQVRAHCELAFARLRTEKERIELFSTPKVHRLLEVLRLFRPARPATAAPGPAAAQPPSATAARPTSVATVTTLRQLDELNFEKARTAGERLQRKLPATLANDEAAVQQITDSLQRILVSSEPAAPANTATAAAAAATTRPRLRSTAANGTVAGGGQRSAAFPRHRANWNNYINDPNALCGLLFCESKVDFGK